MFFSCPTEKLLVNIYFLTFREDYTISRADFYIFWEHFGTHKDFPIFIIKMQHVYVALSSNR